MDITGDKSKVDLNAVLAEYFRRLDAGEMIDREEFLATHPKLADDLRAYFQQEEQLWRAARPAETVAGQHTPTPGRRLEVRCPHCHSPQELSVDAPLTDLTCGSCGSHFSLVDPNKATWEAPSLSTMGRFELVERLGVGGFGSVWKARDKQLDRTVAIKVPRQADMTPDEQEKFFREARAAAQLRHPNIVSVHEVGRDGDSVYIVSDFVRGVTLGDWLTGQKLTSREAAALCTKIAYALHHAHEQGVVHRDLKPANIIIDGDGQPHLMDFGLARRDVGEVTVTVDGQVIGTPAYMSPEQAQGEAHTADCRSDVYSLGVILFQLLTGELPFRGNARMIMHQVINEEPPSPRKLNSNTPRDLETITLKCLQKNAERRYPSALEVAEELARWQTGEPIKASPISRIERGLRWAKRQPVVAGLGLTTALLLLLIAVGAAASARYYQQRAATEADIRKKAEKLQLEASQALEREKIARQTADNASRQSFRTAAYSLQKEARTLCEDGELARGMHQLAQAFTYAERSGDEPLEEALRYDLAAWSLHLPRLRAILPHPGTEVRAAALRPDGNVFATAGMDGTIKLWNAENGSPRAELPQLPSGVIGLVWHPEGMKLAAQCQNGMAFLLDTVAGGSPLVSIGYRQAALPDWIPGTIRFHPDGQSVFIGDYNEVKRWSLQDGRQIEPSYQFQRVGSVCTGLGISSLGDKLVFATGKWRIEVREVETGTSIGTSMTTVEMPRCAVLFPDDTHFATGHNIGSTIQIWNIESGDPVGNQLDFGGKPRSCAVSTDGTHLACVGDTPRLVIWEFGDNHYENVVRSFRVTLGDFSRIVVFGPEPSSILTGGRDYACLWQVRTPAPVWTSDPLPAHAHSLDVHPTTREIAIGLWRRAGHSDDGNYIYRIDGETGKRREPPFDATHFKSDWIDDLQYHPIRPELYAITEGGNPLSYWTTSNSHPKGSITDSTYHLSALRFNPMGTRLIAYERYDERAPAQLWDIESRTLVSASLRVEGNPISAVAVHPTKDLFFAFAGGIGQAFGFEDGIAMGSPVELGNVEVETAFVNPNGESIFLGLANRTVEHYSLDLHSVISPTIVTERSVDHLSCSPDGRLLFTNDFSYSTALWHTPTGLQIGPLLSGGKPRRYPRGESFVVSTEDLRIERWPMPPKVTVPSEKVLSWVEKNTGQRLNKQGEISRISPVEWLANTTGSQLGALGSEMQAYAVKTALPSETNTNPSTKREK